MTRSPTTKEETIAGYMIGYREGLLEGRIWHNYEHRKSTGDERQVMTLLAREAFFNRTPVIDAGCGSSPHIAWHLRTHQGLECYFLDANPTALKLHRKLYHEIQRGEGQSESALRPYWVLGDPHQEPYMLTDRAVIIHGVLPRITNNDDLVLPATHDAMVATLEGLLKTRPARVALYSFGEHPKYLESPSRITPALDHLGLRYTRHDNVASADFSPRPDGTLFLITP